MFWVDAHTTVSPVLTINAFYFVSHTEEVKHWDHNVLLQLTPVVDKKKHISVQSREKCIHAYVYELQYSWPKVSVVKQTND